ncbi:hypothetical protein DINM_003855 [Dirofilaria immitis]|nr:hypothetical protein [Dirofilaria immitis]
MCRSDCILNVVMISILLQCKSFGAGGGGGNSDGSGSEIHCGGNQRELARERNLKKQQHQKKSQPHQDVNDVLNDTGTHIAVFLIPAIDIFDSSKVIEQEHFFIELKQIFSRRFSCYVIVGSFYTNSNVNLVWNDLDINMESDGGQYAMRNALQFKRAGRKYVGVKLDNRMERDADIMRKKQEAAAAKKAAEEAAARAEKNKKLQVFDPLK